MTEEEIISFLKESDKVLDSKSFCLFFTRGREFQLEAISELDILKSEALKVIKKSQSENYHDLSNRLRGQIYNIDSLIAELRTYLALKDEKMSEAWSSLIDSQMNIMWAMRSHDVFNSNLQYRSARLEAMERVFFPPQIFFSTGTIVKSSKCTICNSDYNDCEHVKGRIYNGEICARIIEECELLEASVVKNPADKNCRAISIGDGDENRDTLTWRVVRT